MNQQNQHFMDSSMFKKPPPNYRSISRNWNQTDQPESSSSGFPRYRNPYNNIGNYNNMSDNNNKSNTNFYTQQSYNNQGNKANSNYFQHKIENSNNNLVYNPVNVIPFKPDIPPPPPPTQMFPPKNEDYSQIYGFRTPNMFSMPPPTNNPPLPVVPPPELPPLPPPPPGGQNFKMMGQYSNYYNYYGKRRYRGSDSSSRSKRKRPLSQALRTKRDWSMDDAKRALEVEKVLNAKNKKQALLIRFPDIELTRDMVFNFHSGIENVHFQHPSAARYCFVSLIDSADPDTVIRQLNQIKFGLGYLSAEFKKEREDDIIIKPNDIDPLTLYVGNLAQEITKDDMIKMFPKQKRIDIGYAKRMKYTRYAFVAFHNVDDAIEAFQTTHHSEIHSKSIIVRFRRLHGTVGMPGSVKFQEPNQTDPETELSSNLSTDLDNERDHIEPNPWDIDISHWEPDYNDTKPDIDYYNHLSEEEEEDQEIDEYDEQEEDRKPDLNSISSGSESRLRPGSVDVAFSLHRPLKTDLETNLNQSNHYEREECKPDINNLNKDKQSDDTSSYSYLRNLHRNRQMMNIKSDENEPIRSEQFDDLNQWDPFSYPNRSDSFNNPNRSNPNQSDQSNKSDQLNRSDRSNESNKSIHSSNTNRSDRSNESNKSIRSDRSNESNKSIHSSNMNRLDRSNESNKSIRSDRSNKSIQLTNMNQSDRSDHLNHSNSLSNVNRSNQSIKSNELRSSNNSNQSESSKADPNQSESSKADYLKILNQSDSSKAPNQSESSKADYLKNPNQSESSKADYLKILNQSESSKAPNQSESSKSDYMKNPNQSDRYNSDYLNQSDRSDKSINSNRLRSDDNSSDSDVNRFDLSKSRSDFEKLSDVRLNDRFGDSSSSSNRLEIDSGSSKIVEEDEEKEKDSSFGWMDMDMNAVVKTEVEDDLFNEGDDDTSEDELSLDNILKRTRSRSKKSV